MAKKEKIFDISTYSLAKPLPAKKYKVWRKQVQAKSNNEEEMQQLVNRLETDIGDVDNRREKVVKRMLISEIVSAVVIVAGAFIANALTAFSPFIFVELGIVLGTVFNFGVFGLGSLISRISKTRELKRLKALQNEINEQKTMSLGKKVVAQKEKVNSNENVEQATNTKQNKLALAEVGEPIERKELDTSAMGNKNPKYVFKASIRTMTAEGRRKTDDTFVNVSTKNLDEFIGKLSSIDFAGKDFSNFSNASVSAIEKARGISKMAQEASESIDKKLENGEITKREANKRKREFGSVALVFEITNMSKPLKGTVESKPYKIDEEQKFFQSIEDVKNRVLEQATALKGKTEQEEQTM